MPQRIIAFVFLSLSMVACDLGLSNSYSESESWAPSAEFLLTEDGANLSRMLRERFPAMETSDIYFKESFSDMPGDPAVKMRHIMAFYAPKAEGRRGYLRITSDYSIVLVDGVFRSSGSSSYDDGNVYVPEVEEAG